jgi:hypothetical protein
MERTEEFPLQMSIRHTLFEALPQVEKDLWEQRALEAKNAEPDK